MKPDETTPNKIGQFLREPVTTTLPACLCGLDTNPVASPRMDIHCPKHDAPKVGGERPRAIFDAGFSQAGGEPESWDREPEPCWSCGGQAEARDDIHVRCIDSRNINCEVMDHWYTRKTWNTRVAQPASEPPCVCGHAWEQHGGIGKRYCSVCPAGRCKGFRASIATAQPPSTPADEATQASIILFGFDYNEVWFRNQLGNDVINTVISRITTALAEARRSGTSTTDARERAQKLVDTFRFGYPPVQSLRFLEWEPLVDTIASALSSTPSVDDYVAWCRYVNHGTDDSGADILTIEICDSDAKHAFKVYRSTSSEQSCKQCGYTHATAYELGRQDERSATPNDEVAQRTCTWTCEPNPDIEMWETDCGNAFQFEADGPTENKMKFCCYCGKRLVERVAEGREEGEGDG